jgi:hypothetical protein
MDNLTIEKTKVTPSIHFDAKNHRLEIKGESYPENAAKFYERVFSWLDEYIGELKDQEVTLELEITYFNSSSSKILMDLFDKLDETAGSGKNISIIWRYHKENELALEYGEEFQEDLKNVKFTLAAFSIKQ